jgi:hypothetical protein
MSSTAASRIDTEDRRDRGRFGRWASHVASLKLILASLLLAAVPTSPLAASPLHDAEFVAKVDRLLLWIAERTNLEAPDYQPAFLFLPIDTINYVAMGSHYNGVNSIKALFSPTDAGLVLLPTEGFTDDMLLHELVHFMRMTSGRGPICIGDLENEAYTLQAEFTAETGIGEPVPHMTRIIASMCPPPWPVR